jgi:hypothetical protein
MNRGNWGVLVAAVLVVGLAGTCLAGAMYRNDSGVVARAIRIEFSEPAEITLMWPSFSQRDPQGPATVIVLSGGEIAAGGWFSFTWRPDSTRVVKVEWLADYPLLPACPPLEGAWWTQSAPRTSNGSPLDMRFCGVSIGGNYGPNPLNVAILPEEFFLYLRELHVNWVGVNIYLTVDHSMDSVVKAAGRVPGCRWGFSDEEIVRLIRTLRGYGFGVYLHVILDWDREDHPGKRVRNWTIGDPYAYEYDPEVSREYWPWDPEHPMHDEFVAEFFSTYTAQLVHYARIAEAEGVGLLALGTEMDMLFRTRPGGSRWPTEFSSQLRAMVDAVRAEYSGMLTYEVNHHRFIHTPTIPGFQGVACVWGDLGLDVVGISAYFPLLEKPQDRVPTVEELEVQ